MTVTEGILQENNGLGLEVVDCQQVATSTGDGGGDISLDLMAPSDEVRRNFNVLHTFTERFGSINENPNTFSGVRF